jgi:Kef-type K+ transport system membrane component KefB
MQHLPAMFFLQMAIILVTCRIVGLIGKRMGQPQVVCEMIAGVLLGPSLLGYFFPGAMEALFTKESREILNVGSQLGVGLYMFLVGMEFRSDLFRSRARSAACVSIAGMVVPFILGAALAPWMLSLGNMFAAKTKFAEAALFMGAAIAITAFPMLARIIYERGLSGTPLGTLTLAAGAIDDAAAWCVLAIVLASFGAGDIHLFGTSMNPAVVAIGGAAIYALFLFTGGKRIMAKLGDIAEKEGDLTMSMTAIVLALFCLCAWFTDFIGIHAVFGGFTLGVIMPRGILTEKLTKRLEPFTVVFLLPMFFTYSGLNTKLSVLFQPTVLLVAVAILAASMVGKGVACWAAARLNGEDNRTAMAVGTLMNSRGLMELIIINIGLKKGIIHDELFSILVVMAIVTTLMASPLFEYVYGRHHRKPSPVDDGTALPG